MDSPERRAWEAALRRLPVLRGPEPAFAETIRGRLVRQEPEYVNTLCGSRMTLAPAGDSAWSRPVRNYH